tara:strand:- start:134 stop:499 length:366 start_codon:yes stop_codon:yes gene_type:complete
MEEERMRAWEFIIEDSTTNEMGMVRYDPAPARNPKNRQPVISLRQIHDLKIIKAKEAKKHAARIKLMNLMYSVPKGSAGKKKSSTKKKHAPPAKELDWEQEVTRLVKNEFDKKKKNDIDSY